jgi:hypothetical protein
MDSTQVGYFILCMIGGLFIVGIPWSGIILLLAKRDAQDKPKQP